MAHVLFVCLHNAGRSQMSQALFASAAGDQHEGRSAGSQADPAGALHPVAIEVMRELHMDLGDHRPHLLTRDDAEWADVVVTMGCGDACPYIPGVRYLSWNLQDPEGLSIDEVRSIRNDIVQRVEALLADIG